MVRMVWRVMNSAKTEMGRKVTEGSLVATRKREEGYVQGCSVGYVLEGSKADSRSRELPRLDVAIAVIAQRPPNGDEDPTEQGHFAMLVAYVSIVPFQFFFNSSNPFTIDYAKLTRKMGSKAAASTGSNLRPKDLASVGSPTQ